MYWNLIVIVLCLLLLLFLLWSELKRLNKAWLPVRITASILSVISLACIALPLTTKQKISASNKVDILLTNGFNNDSVQHLLKENKAARIFTINKAIKAFDATYIPDVTDLSNTFNTTSLHILGQGLDEGELKSLKDASVIFHPAKVNNQIVSVGWQPKLSSGETLIVQGSFNNTTSSSAKIVLSGFDTNLDSTTVAANESSHFQLKTTPKNLDRAVYALTVLSGKDTLESDPVPIQVFPTQPLSILMLADSPDFENKFLKNWLAQNEYKLAVKTTISKEKFDKEYVNISPMSLDRITPSLLEKFDIVVADASTLSLLPPADLATIKNYVSNKGVGLVVKADSLINSSAFYSSLFPLVVTKDSIQHIVKLSISDTTQQTSPLKIEQPVYIKDVAGTQPLVKDQQMHIVVNSKMFGPGKVILTTIPNTYSWQLSGNNNDYSSYWSWLLTKAAKKKTVQEVWSVNPAIPQINEEVHLRLQTTKASIPQAQVGEHIVYLEQNSNLPYEWNGTYWPTKRAWQPLISNDSPTSWWYVYDDKNWKGIKAMDKINATKNYARDHLYKPPEASTTITETTTEIPKIYFFILFIICSAILWFEKKFNNE